MYVPLFADIITAERWLMIMPMAVPVSYTHLDVYKRQPKYANDIIEQDVR